MSYFAAMRRQNLPTDELDESVYASPIMFSCAIRIFLAVLCLASTAQAKGRVALVVGKSDCASTPPLANAANDETNTKKAIILSAPGGVENLPCETSTRLLLL